MEDQPKDQNFFKEILKASLIALIIVVPVRFFVAQPYIVAGASMDTTFENGHYIIVDQLTYRFEEPQRGDVVVFKYPQDPSKYFIKRIIGLPGEAVVISQVTKTRKSRFFMFSCCSFIISKTGVAPATR